MPVVTNAVWQAAPGRGAEVIAAMARARAIHERHGALASAVQAVYAGPNSLRISYLLWYPDMATFGESGDALGADPDWQLFTAEVLQAPNPAANLVANSVGIDVPGFDTAMPERPAAGSVLATTLFQPVPGRFAEVAVNIAEWRAIAARHGLTTRTVQSIVAGPATGLLTVAIVYPNLAAYAASGEALQADAAFQAFWQKILGANAPATPLGQSVGRFLPI